MKRWFQGKNALIFEWDSDKHDCVWRNVTGTFHMVATHDLIWAIQNRQELPYPPWDQPYLRLQEGL